MASFARIFKFTTTFALTLLGLHSAEASVKNCGSQNSKIEITKLELIPDPPIRGKEFELVLKTNNKGDIINNGSITTSLSLNFVPFAPTTIPLCDDIKCPILSGFNDFSKMAIWPDTVTGIISTKVVWKDQYDDELICIQINTKVYNYNKLRYQSKFTQFDANMFMKTLSFQKEPEAFNSICSFTLFTTDKDGSIS